jgi:glutaredoxin
MKNLKKYWFLILVIILIAAYAAIFAYYHRQTSVGAVLFYSTSCPHCQTVEKYIADNQIKDKLDFKEAEVSSSANASLLVQVSRNCNLDIEQGIGVPLFFDGNRCYQGDVEIIDYLKAYEK